MATRSHEAAVIIRVRLPSPLRSYAEGKSEIDVAVPVLAPESPASLASVLAAMDVSYPGIRFRVIDEQGAVRPHIKLFVGRAMTRDLATRVPGGSELMIVAALSGG